MDNLEKKYGINGEEGYSELLLQCKLAIAWYKKILEEDPNNEQAKRDLKETEEKQKWLLSLKKGK